MKSHPAEETIVMALDGELPPEELAAVVSHMEQCADCKAQWQRMVELSAQVREYHQRLPLGESRPMPQRPRRLTVRRYAWPAIAAALLVGLGLYAWRRSSPPIQVMPDIVFVALPYSDRSLPLDNPIVVRLDLPREAVVQAGLRPPAGAPSRPVTVEVILGVDGQPRAMRVAQLANYPEGERMQ